MGKFQIEVFVNETPDTVFDYLSDVEATPQWYSAVTSARALDPDKHGLGSRFEIKRSLPQGDVTDEVKITRFDRPVEFEFGTSEGSTPFRYSYELAAEGEGTVVKLEGDITLSGPSKLLSPIATQAFKRGMRDNLNTMKGIIESNSGARPAGQAFAVEGNRQHKNT